jgi:alanine racemase
MMGVGDSTEALELRQSGIAAPIVILGAIIEEEIPQVVEYDIHVTVHSKALLPLLDQEARRQHKLLSVHMKVDTGMTRLGVSCENAAEVAREIQSYPNLLLRGVSTHLSSIASGNVEYSQWQMERFRAVVETLRREDLVDVESCLFHAANSAGVFTLPDSHFDMVRTGIALYGVVPDSLAAIRQHLSPVLSLKTRIAFLKQVPAGTWIGYDQKFRTDRDTLIATCPIGYNDGYPYSLSSKAFTLVRGRRVPVVGSITMDYIMLDVGSVPEVSVGDEVTLIGRDGEETISMLELAKSAGTIPYEISCRLGRRVKRIYVDAEKEGELTRIGQNITRKLPQVS